LVKLITIFILFGQIFFSSLWGKVILIDPGHGGEDLGAWKKGHDSKIVYEKDLALDLAKRIQKNLKKRHTVYLSRSYDTQVGLDERAAKAEKVKADLVISVHINSSRNSSSRGIETYYLGNSQDEAVKKVESEENKKMVGISSIIQQILADLIVAKTVPKSRALASKVHETIMLKMKKKYKIKDRGIKPAIFYILALSKRPGILLEVGFMSNKNELKLLNSESFKRDYSMAVADGVDEYLQKIMLDEINLF
jgi:N-acetylmuramoyl-L-alanine amidase